MHTGLAIRAVTSLSIATAMEPVLGASWKRTPLVAVRWKARTRITAIWARSTVPPGQNRSVRGALQGFMIPAAATLSIAAS